MSVACSWLAMYSNPSLVEKLEVVVLLGELSEDLCWQEWVACLLLTEFGNCVFFSSQKSVDIRGFESGPQFLLGRC